MEGFRCAGTLYPDMELSLRFGANVKRLRKQAGLSQEALADLAGLARSYMSEVEVGRRNPTLKIVAKIAGALGAEPSELLKYSPD